MHSEPELDAQARSSHVGRIAKKEREREADSIFITSYRLQTNVAVLTDRLMGKSKFCLRVRTPASSSLAGIVCEKNEREQSMKLRHKVNVETLPNEVHLDYI